MLVKSQHVLLHPCVDGVVEQLLYVGDGVGCLLLGLGYVVRMHQISGIRIWCYQSQNFKLFGQCIKFIKGLMLPCLNPAFLYLLGRVTLLFLFSMISS